MTRLRMLQEAEIDALESRYLDPSLSGPHQQFGFRDPGKLRRQLADGTTLRPDGGLLVIANEADEPVGQVTFSQRQWGPQPYSWSWMIGIMVLPQHRGHGHGSAAQRQLAAYLFAHTVAERVEASTAADNLAEQHALERAGFTREGVMRRAQWREGGWRDEVVFSKLRGEP